MPSNHCQHATGTKSYFFCIREESYSYPAEELFQTLLENLDFLHSPQDNTNSSANSCPFPQDQLHSGWLHESPRTSKVNAGQEQNTFPRTKVVHWAALYTTMTIKRHYILLGKNYTDPRNTENLNIASDEWNLLQNKKQSSHLCASNIINCHLEVAFPPLCSRNLSLFWKFICSIEKQGRNRCTHPPRTLTVPVWVGPPLVFGGDWNEVFLINKTKFFAIPKRLHVPQDQLREGLNWTEQAEEVFQMKKEPLGSAHLHCNVCSSGS